MDDPLAGSRLCHINLAKGYRGGERQTELLIRELASRGIRQSLITRKRSPLAGRCRDVSGLDIRQAGSRIPGAAVAARGADIIHAHEAHAFYAAALASLAKGIPYVLTRRVPNPQKPSLARTITYGRAGRLVGVSQAVVENLRVRYPVLDVTIVADAHSAFVADAAVVEQLRARHAGKTVIGHVGALDDAHKGTRTILAAARRAVTERPDWQFVLCGDGRDEAVLKEEAKDLGNVTFAGYVDNPGDYLASFDVFLFPSNYEGLGSSLLDAMYFGLPIVATNVGGIPEVVEDAVNGFLVEPRDADTVFERIDRILGNEAERDRMSAANRARAERYGASAMADAYLAIYTSLVPGMTPR